MFPLYRLLFTETNWSYKPQPPNLYCPSLNNCNLRTITMQDSHKMNCPQLFWQIKIYGEYLLLSLLKLMKITINRKNLGWLTWSHLIYWWWQVQSQNRHPCHILPQTCGVSKAVCLIWIWPTDNFLTHSRTSYRINELWSSKYNKHNSMVKKIIIVRINWRIYYIN